MKKVGALGGWLAVFCVASTSSLDVRGDDAAVAEWGYSVTVDGRPVEVVEIPAPVHNLRGGNAQPYAYAQFDIAKESVVRVKSVAAVGKDACLAPKSFQAKMRRVGAHEVSFRMKPSSQLVFEPEGRHRALVLAANPPETNVPRSDAPGVVWIGPGRHRRNVRVSSNQTLYLAPGAVVEGQLVVRGTNVTVRGRGRFDGGAFGHCKGPARGNMTSVAGSNIRIQDVVFASSWAWCLVLASCNDVCVENVKILGGHVLNDDGIDLCRAKDVSIRNSFIRAQDDCIAVKYWAEGVVVEDCTLWPDFANAVRIGYECDDGRAFRNIVFRRLAVPHLSLAKRKVTHAWANCFLEVQAANGACVSDLLVEDVAIDSAEQGDNFVILRTLVVDRASHADAGAGHIDGVTLRRVAFPPAPPDSMRVQIDAFDAGHGVRNVVFEDVSAHGPLTLRNADAPVARNGGGTTR